MDFRELNYVIALARHGTIVKAAKSLYISQPSLTKFLQNLESELGVPLFMRVGKKYQLTYAGERYVQTATRILDLKMHLDREMKEIAREDLGLLRVGFPLVRGSYILPNVLPAFHEMHPNVKVEVHEVDSVQLLTLLLESKIDVAIMSKAEMPKQIAFEEIAQEEYVLILQSGHPLGQAALRSKTSKYPFLDPRKAGKEDFIMLEGSQRSKRIIEEIFKKYQIAPNVVLTLRNVNTLIRMVNAGFGFSFVLESHVLKMPKASRPRCYSIEENGYHLTCCAAYRSEAYHPQYEKDFIELVRNFYKKMLDA